MNNQFISAISLVTLCIFLIVQIHIDSLLTVRTHGANFNSTAFQEPSKILIKCDCVYNMLHSDIFFKY